MTIVNTVERAHACLLAAFGTRWKAPYAEGKARMADQVSQELQVPHEAGVEIKDAREGALQAPNQAAPERVELETSQA
jgi:hypothetical protein